MIDHINIPVSDLNRSRHFYDQLLDVLGMVMIAEDGPAIGYGVDSWVFGIDAGLGGVLPLHVAFKTVEQAQVDAFYNAGLAAGGACNGKPGLRSEYGDGYYAAFLRDPDGHNIEAVFRG